MWLTLLIILLVLFALSFTKFEIRKEIVINARPQEIWSTIIDFEAYKYWNSQLIYLGGDIEPNGKLHLKLAIAGAEPYEFKPRISQWEENIVFGWLAITGLRGIFDGEHIFELKNRGNGKTLLINREEYRGILSLIMKNLPMMKDAPEGFEIMNQEIKDYIECKK